MPDVSGHTVEGLKKVQWSDAFIISVIYDYTDPNWQPRIPMKRAEAPATTSTGPLNDNRITN